MGQPAQCLAQSQPGLRPEKLFGKDPLGNRSLPITERARDPETVSRCQSITTQGLPHRDEAQGRHREGFGTRGIGAESDGITTHQGDLGLFCQGRHSRDEGRKPLRSWRPERHR
jgi:hypothetical protein